MRNPYRIGVYCERLKKAWEKVPDLRLGQLLEDAGVQFYTEDGEAIRRVEEFVEKVTGENE